MTTDKTLQLAAQHHQAGRLAEADRLYQQVVHRAPQNAKALHSWGVLHAQAGRFDKAGELIRQAVKIDPRKAEYYCDLGNVLAASGERDKATEMYRHAVRLKPDFAQAHYNFAINLQSQKKLDEAAAEYRQAIRYQPDYIDAYINLGANLLASGKLIEAEAINRELIRRQPKIPQAHFNLANVLKELGNFQEAVAEYQLALSLRPGHAQTHLNLGNVLKDLGKLNEAVAQFHQALHLQPNYAEAFNNLGTTLKDLGKLDEAIASYHQALRLRPDAAEVHVNLAHAQRDLGKLDAAVAEYQQALSLRPADAEVHISLGNALKELGKLDEAVAEYKQAASLRPDYAEAHLNLGVALLSQGQSEGAIANFRRALQIKPEYPVAQSNLLYALYFHPDSDSQSILREHQQWQARHAQPLQNQAIAHDNDCSLNRRLRIGYVSPDFRIHVVGRHILPLLEHHDHQNFEIFCYSNSTRSDAMTTRLQSHADHWRDVAGITDQRLAEMIRNDRIDILIDLALHMADNRMLMFARKPAPVQVTYLGYVGTTGLATMDYRISDAQLDPPGNEAVYAEQTVRLPRSYWCYEPADATPQVSPLPSASAGYITFGCLNNFAKVSNAALELWAKILLSAPKSRLLLHAHLGSHRNRVIERMTNHGIDASRIEFVPATDWQQYMQHHARLDIALDPFPYGGGITTLDGLWMGVPIVTIKAKTAVGRAGCSILHTLGLPDLIADSPEEYVKIASELAHDQPRLIELRSTLRQRMQRSPLTNAAEFARDMETVYRQIWQTWCERNSRI
jgi:protein O-GlcNAc transferase